MSMLDPRKQARMVSNRARMRAGRTITVVCVYNRPEGTAYVATQCVWREQPYTDPTNVQPPVAAIDVRAEFDLSVDVTQMAFIANTPTPNVNAVTLAPQYEIVTYKHAGIITNRWIVQLRRIR